ncbi:DUF1440 domain-containing protein [Sphingomonas sp. S1-29]|uniref:DUF1440 domain-containing protein n=1 Tax=Sphingomonas sp. S1-29 TaxID=2991074 RepID=UPI00223F2D01|nr:DUF1440 domain-containing protein [Sphingomonas sp. S1-29]UZK70169.1 DUF1440 domain-containing protein [Sphingomonas sp. S1-29]
MQNGSDIAVTPSIEDVAKGALAGLAAGLVASFAMNQFQAVTSKLMGSGDDAGSDEEPATVKAAERLSALATGEELADEAKAGAGNAVHYALGGALGLAYGIAAEFRPAVTKGFGSGFGMSTFALLDEIAVPASGLGAGLSETPASTHLYSAASHVVFGSVTEAVRLGVRRLLRAR